MQWIMNKEIKNTCLILSVLLALWHNFLAQYQYMHCTIICNRPLNQFQFAEIYFLCSKDLQPVLSMCFIVSRVLNQYFQLPSVLTSGGYYMIVFGLYLFVTDEFLSRVNIQWKEASLKSSLRFVIIFIRIGCFRTTYWAKLLNMGSIPLLAPSC